MTFALTKLHGLGNDFLVHLTDQAPGPAEQEAWSARAEAWCDRHRGIGADGLMVGVHGAAAEAAGTDLVMHLWNADGSRAEISGNGIRCLAHAEVRQKAVASAALSIATDGGVREVHVAPVPGRPEEAAIRVDMGPVVDGPAPTDRIDDRYRDGTARHDELVRAAVERRSQATLDIGNPHLILLVDDLDLVDMGLAGFVHEAMFDGGINVHAMAPTPEERDAISVLHWERGVGLTEACGSGASVCAEAAHRWGLVGRDVTVHMPGGDAVVHLGDTVVLEGPSVHIAELTVEDLGSER